MINRCVCHNLLFSRILEIANESGIRRLTKLKDKYNFANKCCRCNPYLREMLISGTTEFEGELKRRKKHD